MLDQLKRLSTCQNQLKYNSLLFVVTNTPPFKELQLKKQLVYIDMDGVLADFETAYNSARRQNPEELYPQSVKGFFRNLTPIEGAIGAFKILAEQHNVFILTAPSVLNPLSYTEKRLWVEHHLGLECFSKLILCNNKELLKGNYLIDDNLVGKGQEHFRGKLLQFGAERYPSWIEILRFFNR